MRYIGLWLKHDGLWLERMDRKVQDTTWEVQGKAKVKLNAISSYFLKYQQCILHSGGDKDEQTLTLPSKSYIRDFPGGAVVKNLPGDQGSIPGLGRSPGEGNGNPLQYTCLGNPMGRAAWWAIVRGVAESQA